MKYFKNERLMMTEEEARNRAKELLNENQVDLITKYMFLEQHCKKQKELIDTILNWNIFKNECPMNFGYDEETNENKAQDVFYKDDDYCENNCNDDYTKCWLKYFKRMHELEKGDTDEITFKAIQRYCEENNIIPNIISEDKLKLVLQLGIAEYNRKLLEKDND